MNYLSICCIIRNENQYLPEWIDYHRKVGVEHFYLYDHLSSVPISDTLAEHVKSGLVDVTKVTGSKPQMPSYANCLSTFGSKSKWIGFIDMDEFVVPKGPTDMREFLTQYEEFGGLGVNWLVFGSNGLKERPESQLKTFLLRSESKDTINRHIKSFVQPARTATAGPDPHHFRFKPPFFCVNEKKIRVNGPFSPNSTETIQLNHYYLRSRGEWAEKMIRGRADGVPGRSWKEFEDQDAISNMVRDEEILKLLG